MNDQELKGIIEEDEESNGGFGHAQKFAQQSSMQLYLILLVEYTQSMDNIYLITISLLI